MSNTTETQNTSQEASEAVFNITENAAKRISHLVSEETDKNSNLRIEVLGGGCSGFQYNFDFDSKINPDDKTFKRLDIQVIIDKSSFDFLNNSTLDYVETLGSSAFEIKNPNSTANCGCGNSFSV